MLMFRLEVVAGLVLLCLHLSGPQVIRVIQIPVSGGPERFNRNIPVDQNYNTENQVIFEFLRPKGLGISIPGPYPPSSQYKLKFHLNINKEFDGWKRGEYNEGVIVKYGVKWSYTFPYIEVKQGDTVYYWIEAEGNDWEKGYKGKYQVDQPSPHGTRTPVSSNSCTQPSVTTYSGGKKACAGERLIRSYSFVDQKYLRDESRIFMKSVKQIGGLDPEDQFTVFSNDSIIMNRTHCAIFPALLEAKYGPSFVNARNFTIAGCTSKHRELCSASAMAYLILPPALAGRHSCEDSFSFRYGIVEVTAKLPRGDWLVPELWLLPKDGGYNSTDMHSGKIVLAMSRGNSELSNGTQDFSNQVLEAGVQHASGDLVFKKVHFKPWASDYHKFKLIWTQEKLQFLVDDEEIGIIQAGEQGLNPSSAPFDQEFYLVFGVHVGGDRDFPDSLVGKPWKNYEPKNKLKFWQARDQWQPTWGIHSALMIRDLTVTAL